eukprot:9860169-Alexandrium_andersonii.AAC.1
MLRWCTIQGVPLTCPSEWRRRLGRREGSHRGFPRGHRAFHCGRRRLCGKHTPIGGALRVNTHG